MARRFHDETTHTPYSIRASGHTLDWDNKPFPFKVYTDVPALPLPRDLAGSRATIEGTVQVAALSEEDRAHLESEGATAAGQDVSIEATAVLVHP